MRLAQSTQDPVFLWMAHYALGDIVLAWRVDLGSDTLGAGDCLCMTPATSLPYSPSRLTWGRLPLLLQPGPCGILATRTKP